MEVNQDNSTAEIKKNEQLFKQRLEAEIDRAANTLREREAAFNDATVAQDRAIQQLRNELATATESFRQRENE